MRALESRALFLQRLDDRLNGISTIAGASSTNYLPFSGASLRRFEIDGRPDMTGEQRPLVGMVAVGSRYFDALGVRMLRGRAFTATDGEPGREAMIINQRLADMHFRGEDPVGKRIRLINDGNIPGAPKFYAGHGRRRVADDQAARLRARSRSCGVHHARAERPDGDEREPHRARPLESCGGDGAASSGNLGDGSGCARHQHPDDGRDSRAQSLAAAHLRHDVPGLCGHRHRARGGRVVQRDGVFGVRSGRRKSASAWRWARKGSRCGG